MTSTDYKTDKVPNLAKAENKNKERKIAKVMLPMHTLVFACVISQPSELLLLASELSSNALGDDLLIGPAIAVLGRGHDKLVARIELASRPAGPTKVDVRVLVHRIELLAKSRQAAGIVAATGLRQNGLALVLAQPVAESVESLNVVRCASGVGTGSIFVEVLVHVEDQVGGAVVKVFHLLESSARAIVDESTGVGPLVSRKQDFVLGRAGLADGSHRGLDTGCPFVNVWHVVLGDQSVLMRRSCGCKASLVDLQARSSHRKRP